MPAVNSKSCFDPSPILIRDHGDNAVNIEEQFHFEGCNSANLYQDGFWRWFIAGSRCDCDCHTMLLTKERIKRQNQKVLLFLTVMAAFFLATLIYVTNSM